MRLAKNLGGMVGVKENFKGGGGGGAGWIKKNLKILLQIFAKFSEKMSFFSQKIQKFVQTIKSRVKPGSPTSEL